MTKRLKITSKKSPRIVNTGPKQPRVDPAWLAQQLGAKAVCGDCAVWTQRRSFGHPCEHPACKNMTCGCFCHDQSDKRRRGAMEFMLQVSWSGLNDPGDDGRGHLQRRGSVTCDMGLEVPDPPPTNEEMRLVMHAAKMALWEALQKRPKV
jgi:hypothetical protein